MDITKPLKKTMKVSCCVPDCNTLGYMTDNKKTVIFHFLPKDAKMLKIWIVTFGRDVSPGVFLLMLRSCKN